MAHHFKFQHQTNLTKENSFGTLARKNNATVNVEVFVGDDGDGWYEFYDESDPEEFHAEGELVVEGNELIDFDGCYSLPDFIINKLAEVGIKDGL